jgi:hypothetical protein
MGNTRVKLIFRNAYPGFWNLKPVIDTVLMWRKCGGEVGHVAGTLLYLEYEGSPNAVVVLNKY